LAFLLAISIQGGRGDPSNDDRKVVTPPDIITLTSSPRSSGRSDGKAITDFVPESSLFVLDLRFARIDQSLVLTLDMMTTQSIGKILERENGEDLRNNAGACCRSASYRIVCNCGSKRFFMYTPALFLSDMR
jgi:hypothetical protein